MKGNSQPRIAKRYVNPVDVQRVAFVAGVFAIILAFLFSHWFCPRYFQTTLGLPLFLGLLFAPLVVAHLLNHWGKARAYRFGRIWVLYATRMFNAYALLTGLATFCYFLRMLTPLLKPLLSRTQIESLAEPGIFFLSLLPCLLVTGFLQLLPSRLRDGVLAGELFAVEMFNVVNLASVWLMAIAVNSVLAIVPNFPQVLLRFSLSTITICWILIGSVAIVGYVSTFWLIKTLLRQNQDTSEFSNLQNELPSYWLVFASPVQDVKKLNLIDQIAASWPGPFTLVAPAGSKVMGTHLCFAHSAKCLKALFPQRSIEIPDWRRITPKFDRWPVLSRREIYPSAKLLVETVTTLRNPHDQAILICGDAHDLEEWRGLLPIDKTKVLLLGNLVNAEQLPKQIVGYHTLTLKKLDQLFVESLVELASKLPPKRTQETLASLTQEIALLFRQSLATIRPAKAQTTIDPTQPMRKWIQTLFSTFWGRVQLYILVSLLIVSVGLYLYTGNHCYAYDPPFECKFNQGE